MLGTNAQESRGTGGSTSAGQPVLIAAGWVSWESETAIDDGSGKCRSTETTHAMPGWLPAIDVLPEWSLWSPSGVECGPDSALGSTCPGWAVGGSSNPTIDGWAALCAPPPAMPATQAIAPNSSPTATATNTTHCENGVDDRDSASRGVRSTTMPAIGANASAALDRFHRVLEAQLQLIGAEPLPPSRCPNAGVRRHRGWPVRCCPRCGG